MNNSGVNIVKISVADISKLKEISKQTFVDSYSWGNTAENVQNYVEINFHKEKLVDELNNPNTEFYFGELGHELIGYFKINFYQAQTDLKDNKSLEIERIYILSQFQGKKIGSVFIDEICKIAKQNQLAYVWLGVWENNIRAIQFYEKNSFIQFATHPFKFGNELQTDVLMKRTIDINQQ